MAVALVTLGCWSIPAFAQRQPTAPSGLRTQDEDALRRARAAAAVQPVRPSFSLSVNQNDLYVNEVVTVTLNPIDVVRKSPFFLFTVDFGDGETIEVPAQLAQVQHRYRAANSYTISATVGIRREVRRTFDGSPGFSNTVGVIVRKTTLSATPAVAAVGEPMTFATPVRPGDSRVRYKFTFADGDDTGWIADVQTTHAYKSSGPYNPTMEVGIFDDGENFSWDKSEPVLVQVADVTLDAPASLSSDQAGMFTVRFSGNDPALRYRVNFADNSAPSEWSSSPTVPHTYGVVGTYRPFGEIGRASDIGVTRVAASAVRDVAVIAAAVVIPNPDSNGGPRPVNWLPYVAIAIAAVLLGYSARKILSVPRPTFTPHRGQTDSQMKSADGGVNLELEVRLHREADSVQTTLNVPGGRLIADSETV